MGDVTRILVYAVRGSIRFLSQCQMLSKVASGFTTFICATNWCRGVDKMCLLCDGTTICSINSELRFRAYLYVNIRRTFPISVTLTALSKVTDAFPCVSLTIATLLTPCSLINFIACKTGSLEMQYTTAERKFREGNDRLCSELER